MSSSSGDRGWSRPARSPACRLETIADNEESALDLRHGADAAWKRKGATGLTIGHVPVMRDEAVEQLLASTGSQGCFVDGTFGSTEILRRLGPDGRLWGFDIDPIAVEVGKELAAKDARFSIVHQPFANLVEALPPGTKLNGVLLDIGFSSPQMDEASRGWNAVKNAPLDLRMNQSAGISAGEWLRFTTEEELVEILLRDGDNDDPLMCQRLATAIVKTQEQMGDMTFTTGKLASLVKFVKGEWDRVNRPPAKLVFQAVRMFLNEELDQLKAALEAAFTALVVGGRLVVITFKHREEEVVEDFFRRHTPCPPDYVGNPEQAAASFPMHQTDDDYEAYSYTTVRPSEQEVLENPRSRSARVTVLVKVPRSDTLRLVVPSQLGNPKPPRDRDHPIAGTEPWLSTWSEEHSQKYWYIRGYPGSATWTDPKDAVSSSSDS